MMIKLLGNAISTFFSKNIFDNTVYLFKLGLGFWSAIYHANNRNGN
ncbi:hypothetical protein N824_15120 [Pedobacter sp. V48]|nr:hypothetical protein N824_15120 [Pedobacter sp. V48]